MRSLWLLLSLLAAIGCKTPVKIPSDEPSEGAKVLAALDDPERFEEKVEVKLDPKQEGHFDFANKPMAAISDFRQRKSSFVDAWTRDGFSKFGEYPIEMQHSLHTRQNSRPR